MPQNSQYLIADQLVHQIRGILGNFAGYRALHADGRLYRGFFRANPTAQLYSRASHLNGDEVAVSVRFSKGGGDPFAHFTSTVGMATRFYLDDGRVTNLVMLSQKLFIARSIEQFRDLLEAAAPKTPGERFNQEGLQQFLAKNPNSAAVFKMRAESPAPVSFAHTEFHAVHAFYFVNRDEVRTPVRLHWVPVAGVQGQPLQNLTDMDVAVLFDEIESRLAMEAVEFDLQIELAELEDPLNDATALWPPERTRVSIGRLVLLGPTSERALGDPIMNHDPTMLTDGIEPSDDPILQIRRGVYEASAAQRSGGWQRQQQET